MMDVMREWSISGVIFPAITGLFVLSLMLMWLLDMLFARLGVYRYVWHPALFKLSVFACLFCFTAFMVYQ